MEISIDFDGTLCPDAVEHDEPASPPHPAAVRLLRSLHADGHRITVLSSRAHGSMEGGWRWRHAVRVIRRYLEDHGIPHDVICPVRPPYDVSIDRRAAGGDWSRDALRRLRRLLVRHGVGGGAGAR